MNNHLLTILLTCLLSLSTPLLYAKDCVIPVPGDVNGDCIVDMKDFEILSKNWLRDGRLPTELPILKILDSGISGAQARELADAFKIPLILTGRHSPALFFDGAAFQHVPTLPVEDQKLIKLLSDDSEVDGEGPLAFEAIDTQALARIRVLPGDVALNQVLIALSKSKLLPIQSEPTVNNSAFEAFDVVGRPIVPSVLLDTQVQLQTFANNIPVIGPGEQHSFSFAGDGSVSQLHIARRGFEPGSAALLLPAVQKAADVFIQSNGTFVPDGDIKLVYYAPPLSFGQAQTLIPHYDMGGTLYSPSGQQFAKLRKLVPAVDDSKLVPSLALQASVKGNLVTAKAQVNGGTPPYQFQWASSSADLSGIPNDQSIIEYNAFPKLQSGAEIVTVIVTDQNGVSVDASKTVTILLGAMLALGDPILPAGAPEPDFGVERGVGDLGAANQNGFVSRFQSDGYYRRFNWGATSAWEQDFKKVGGVTYIDEADIVFYVGHGYGGGFTFETNNDDSTLTYTDAVGAWGGNDLEWLTLLSCQVLTGTYDSKSWATRWGPAFNGLHLLCGFQTNAYDWHNFSHRFADWTLGRNLGFIKLPPIPVRAAWFQAKKEEQPSSVESVVMGPVGPGGILGGYNDYFWGKGPVSADLRGDNIRGYWRLVYK